MNRNKLYNHFNGGNDMFGSQHYTEGAYRPLRGGDINWHVWCNTGALEVLNANEFETVLGKNPEGYYTINFANASAARITPDHPLWKKLAEIAKTFSVEVYPLDWSKKYLPWTGDDYSLHSFDAIQIMKKVPVPAQKIKAPA